MYCLMLQSFKHSYTIAFDYVYYFRFNFILNKLNTNIKKYRRFWECLMGKHWHWLSYISISCFWKFSHGTGFNLVSFLFIPMGEVMYQISRRTLTSANRVSKSQNLGQRVSGFTKKLYFQLFFHFTQILPQTLYLWGV